MAYWERYLTKSVFVLLVLAALGPLVGRATLAQTLALTLLAAGILLLGDVFLLPRALPYVDDRLAAAGDGLLAALILRYLGPLLGAGYGWGGALVLGAGIGLSEYLLHRWTGVAAGGRGGLDRNDV